MGVANIGSYCRQKLQTLGVIIIAVIIVGSYYHWELLSLGVTIDGNYYRWDLLSLGVIMVGSYYRWELLSLRVAVVAHVKICRGFFIQ